MRSPARMILTRLAMISALVALLAATLPLVPSVAAVEEWDCEPYDAWEWAQSAYERAMHEAADETEAGDELDLGIVCDHLPNGAAPALWTDELPEDATEAVVTRIVDGDTIEIVVVDETGVASGQPQVVRLLLADTPETLDPREPVQCFGYEATAFTEWLLGFADTVWLEQDITDTDLDDRLLRYVWFELAEGEVYLLNEAIVRSGYGALSTYPPDVAYVDEIEAAEAFAVEHELGLWDACDEFGAPLEEPVAQAPAGITDTTDAAPAAPAQPAAPTPTPEPAPAVVTAPQVVSLTSPIGRGQTASIGVQTTPGASCTITVTYMSGPSTAQGLVPKVADGNGYVAWSWMVGTRTTPGEWPITVTCAGQTLRTSFQVV